MPVQTFRYSAFDWNDVHVHVSVPVVLTAEREELSIGGERGVGLHTDVAGQTAYVLPVETCNPNVSGIGKRNVVAADRRLGKQFGVVDIDAQHRQSRQSPD